MQLVREYRWFSDSRNSSIFPFYPTKESLIEILMSNISKQDKKGSPNDILSFNSFK